MVLSASDCRYDQVKTPIDGTQRQGHIVEFLFDAKIQIKLVNQLGRQEDYKKEQKREMLDFTYDAQSHTQR